MGGVFNAERMAQQMHTVLLVLAVVVVCCSAADATDVDAQTAKIEALEAENNALKAEIKAQAAKIKAQAAENQAHVAKIKAQAAQITAFQAGESQAIAAPARQAVALLGEKLQSQKGGYGYGGYGSKAKPFSKPQKASEKDPGALARCESAGGKKKCPMGKYWAYTHKRWPKTHAAS